jgi:hypothetical protein
MPGAPQPPSLHLPDRVTDLAATRAGDQVTLTWTMPKRNTDKLLLKGPITARVCLRTAAADPCQTVITLQFGPGAGATFTEALPAAQASGSPRAITFCVELLNRKQRSAGLSNGAEVLAGEAPAAVEGLHAEMRREGVLLKWSPGAEEVENTQVRLERRLLSQPSAQSKSAANPLTPPPEPVEQSLLVPAGNMRGSALDKNIRFGESYEYRAQRVARVTVDGERLELDGPLSAPVHIDAVQQFPPAVPTGLVAVATAGEDGTPAAIDLSWQPNSDEDLSGYAVYRREVLAPGASGAASESAWQRVSPAQPVVGPGFHDAGVQPGHTYAYAVSAIDREGHESARSAEAQESVPGP